MQRRVMITVLLAAAAVPGFAQFRGGAVRGGGAGIAPRGGLVVSGAGVGQSRGIAPFVNPFFPGGFRPGFRPGFGFPCARSPFLCGARFHPRFWPWYSGYGAWYPYGWDYADYTGNDAAAAQLQAELANQQNLNSQLLVELAKQREDRLDAESAAAQRLAPRPPAQTRAQERPTPATVLVFRDGSRQEVQNYAIVGNTLFNLEPNRTQKILLSALDIPASIRANDERGVEFSVPSQPQARP